MKNFKKTILIALLFLFISIGVVSKVFFNDKLIGRSIDNPVPPVSYLIKNVYFSNFYQWWGVVNGGGRNPFQATLIPVNSILYFPVLFGAGPWLTVRYQIALTLFLAMIFFYLLSQKILEAYKAEEKTKTLLAVLGSIFFALNSYFFCEIIFGSNVMYLTFAFIPLLLYAAISYYKNANKKLFFVIALISVIIISSVLQHFVMAYILLLALSVSYKDIKFFIKLGFWHFLLSLYWFIPLLHHASSIRSTEVAIAGDSFVNLTISASRFLNALINKEYFFNRDTYNLALNNKLLVSIWLINAFLLLAASLFCLLKLKVFQKNHKKIILGFSAILFLSILFIKGANEPFGNIVLFLYKNVPFLSLYRSLQHYIGFYVISVSLLFVFSGIYIANKNKKHIYLLALLVIINAMPWWLTRDLGTKNIISTNKIPSYLGQFYLTEGNKKMYDLNTLPLDFAIMHIPPGFSMNFLAAEKNESDYIMSAGDKVKSQGGDPGLVYANKRFYATDQKPFELSPLLDNLEKSMYEDGDFLDENKNVFSALGVRYFVLREDVKPVFSKNSTLFNLDNIKLSIENSDIAVSADKNDFITILRNDSFLPHFYVPANIIQSNQSPESFLEVATSPDFQSRSAIYFEDRNKTNDIIDNNSDFRISLFKKEDKKKTNNIKLPAGLNDRNFSLYYSLNPGVEIKLSYSGLEKQLNFGIEMTLEKVNINGENIKNGFYSLYVLSCEIGDIVKIGDNKIFEIKKGLDEKLKIQELNEISVYKTKSNNLLSGSSFENGLWGEKVFDCTNDKDYDQTLSMQISGDSKDGKHSLELSSGKHSACTSRTFPVSLKQGKAYKYSFDYKSVEGGQIQYFYQLMGKEKNYPFSEIINANNHEWNHFDILIENVEEDMENFEIFFYALAGAEKNVNRFDNVELVEWMPKEAFNLYIYSQPKEKIKTPVLEFKKINPTKYKVIVHKANGDFPLVFLDNFNSGWKVYSGASLKIDKQFPNKNYKIFDGSKEDQASKEELADYISKGWISTLGSNKNRKIKHTKLKNEREVLDYSESYSVDFISKNFQDTIQNNNLPKGRIWDTWLKKPVASEDNHLTANGYANSWWIDFNEIKKSGNYIQNSDGSIDFEIIVEYWPQRLFYLGLFISLGMALMFFLIYLAAGTAQKDKIKKLSK